MRVWLALLLAPLAVRTTEGLIGLPHVVQRGIARLAHGYDQVPDHLRQAQHLDLSYGSVFMVVTLRLVSPYGRWR